MLRRPWTLRVFSWKGLSLIGLAVRALVSPVVHMAVSRKKEVCVMRVDWFALVESDGLGRLRSSALTKRP